MSRVEALPTLSQIALGGGSQQKRELTEVGVFRDDYEIVFPCEVPDSAICCGVESKIYDMAAVGVLVGEHSDKSKRQVLVEQELHAGVARRRSRIAANSIAARTCCSVSSGKSLTISEDVIPEAR